MGNAKSKKQKLEEVEILLCESYRNTDVEFTFKEITNFKLRINDAENYFQTKFDFFFYFNNYLFRERLGTLYDNFNVKIESFSANKPKPTLNILIDFDDESDSIKQGSKMDFDSLFTIVFEKLEISILLFFDMTNVDAQYITDFFSQMIESVDLYKYNRKYDCLYFLLPNTDYFIKNDSVLLYVTVKSLHNKKLFFNEETHDIINEFTDCLFVKNEKEKLLNSKYQKNDANNFLEPFLKKVKPTCIKLYLYFKFATEVESFIINNEEQLDLLETVTNTCPVNIVSCNLIDYPIVHFNYENLDMLFRKLITLLDQSKKEENVLIFNLLIHNKQKDTNLQDIIKSSLLIKNIVNNNSNNKRKFIFKLLEINNSDNNKYDIVEEKLFLYWCLSGAGGVKLRDFNIYISILIKLEKFNKLNNRNIIKNLRDMLCTCFLSKYIKIVKQINKDDIINLI